MDCHPIPSRKCTQASGVANFLVMSIRFMCGHMYQAQYCSLRPNHGGEDLRGCASIRDGPSSDEWRQPAEPGSAGFQLPNDRTSRSFCCTSTDRALYGQVVMAPSSRE